MALTRRRFLQWTGAAGLAATAGAGAWPRVAWAAPGDPGRGDALVFVFLRGGMDGLSAVVPYQEPLYYDRRPQIAVPASRVLDLDGRFGLHPALAALHEIYRDGQLAVVPAAGHPQLTRSHFANMERIEAGLPDGTPTATGFLARHLAGMSAAAGSIPAASIGGGLPQSVRGSRDAVAMRDVGAFHLQDFGGIDTARGEAAIAALHDAGEGVAGTLAGQARTTLAAIAAVEAADPAQYEPANGAVYPEDYFAQNLRQVARLLRTGPDLRVELALLDLGGWDTHENMGTAEAGYMASQLRRLGDGLGAFRRDLDDQWDQVSVVLMAEFGRQVHENGSGGTDHGNGGVMLVMGGGIRGGVHGAWPGLEDDALFERNGVAPLNDFRDVFAEVLTRRVGATNLDVVFPGLAHRPLGLDIPRF